MGRALPAGSVAEALGNERRFVTEVSQSEQMIEVFIVWWS